MKILCRPSADSQHKNGGTVAQCQGKDVHVPVRMYRFVGDRFDFAVFDKADSTVVDFVDEKIFYLTEMLVDRLSVIARYGYSVRHGRLIN
jgi:hypothetical protein